METTCPKGVTWSLRGSHGLYGQMLLGPCMRPRGQFKRGPSHPMTTVQYCRRYNILNKEVGVAMIPKLSSHESM